MSASDLNARYGRTANRRRRKLVVAVTFGGAIAVVFAAYASAMAVTWVCMRLSTQMLRVIGTTGIHVVTRLFGILLSALAVQFVLNGLAETPLLHH